MSGYGFSLGGVWMDGVDSMPIVLRGVSGWDDLSEAKTDQERMPGVAGNFDPGETFGDGLPVTVDACAYGTPAECEDLVASVRALRGLARPVEAAFHRRSGVTRRMVEVRAVTGSHESWQSHAEFQVSLLAMDPNAYGEQISTSCGRPTAGDGIMDPLVEPIMVQDPNGLHSEWTGTADASMSILSQAGSVVATNYLPNPTPVAANINNTDPQHTSVADAPSGGVTVSTTSTYTGVGSDNRINGTVLASGTYHFHADISVNKRITAPDFLIWSGIFTVDGDAASGPVDVDLTVSSQFSDYVTIKAGLTVGDSTTFSHMGIYSARDWEAMQALGVTWFSGDSIPYPRGSDGDPGRVQFANVGTASTPLLLTVSGGGMTRGVRLRRVETGDTLELAFPLLDGQSCVFDSAAHRVTMDNQSDMTGYLTRDDWFDAPPGGTTTVQFEPLGDVTGEPRLTLTASPAWY